MSCWNRSNTSASANDNNCGAGTGPYDCCTGSGASAKRIETKPSSLRYN
jgi:hypothetical protein